MLSFSHRPLHRPLWRQTTRCDRRTDRHSAREIQEGDHCFLAPQGEFFAIADPTEAPFSPPPLPSPSTSTAMLYVWLTDYVANTAGYVYQSSGFMKYNITPDLVSAPTPENTHLSSLFTPPSHSGPERFSYSAQHLLLQALSSSGKLTYIPPLHIYSPSLPLPLSLAL